MPGIRLKQRPGAIGICRSLRRCTSESPASLTFICQHQHIKIWSASQRNRATTSTREPAHISQVSSLYTNLLPLSVHPVHTKKVEQKAQQVTRTCSDERKCAGKVDSKCPHWLLQKARCVFESTKAKRKCRNDERAWCRRIRGTTSRAEGPSFH